MGVRGLGPSISAGETLSSPKQVGAECGVLNRIRKILTILFALMGVAVSVLAVMIAFGTSAPPPPLKSIGEPFSKIDFSDLPPIETVAADGGGTIAFRHWDTHQANEREPIVVAIHGSSASSTSLHPLATALSAQGFAVYAPDIRGHGETGKGGDIDCAGQLDTDLADFVSAIESRSPGVPLILLGFSSGGGFALHAAASPSGKAFERAVLLSPMLGPFAPTVKKAGDAWAAPYVPRILGLLALNALGVHAFDALPALAFAIDPAKAKFLTARYSFRLMRAFGTADYAADFKNAKTPVYVLAGDKDELFAADLFAPTIHAIRPDVPVTVVPGVNHIGMTTDPRAVPAIVAALRGHS